MPRQIRVATWPRCSECGGPALPKGPPTFTATFDVVTRNESNLRSRWAKVARTKDARERTIEEVAVALHEGQVIPETGPWFVRMTRRSPMTLDPDGLPRALKSVQDTIAAILKIDDASPFVEWSYEQVVVEGPLGVTIEIWGARYTVSS